MVAGSAGAASAIPIQEPLKRQTVPILPLQIRYCHTRAVPRAAPL